MTRPPKHASRNKRRSRKIFIATCYFSEDAREFAARNNIECLDGPALAAVLKEHDLPLPEGIITEHLKAPASRLRNNFYARLAAAESTPAARHADSVLPQVRGLDGSEEFEAGGNVQGVLWVCEFPEVPGEGVDRVAPR